MARIFQELRITDYVIHAFEPCAASFATVQRTLLGQQHVKLHRAGVAESDGRVPLYHSTPANPMGHSIYATKNNVRARDFEMIRVVQFSRWLGENVPDLRKSCNVLKFNIEGAEYALLRDLRRAELSSAFRIVCGDACDVRKVRELLSSLEEHEENVRTIEHCLGAEIFEFSAQSGKPKVIEPMIQRMREALRAAA